MIVTLADQIEYVSDLIIENKNVAILNAKHGDRVRAAYDICQLEAVLQTLRDVERGQAGAGQ